MNITSLDTIEKLNSFSNNNEWGTRGGDGLEMVSGNINVEIFLMNNDKIDLVVAVNDHYIKNKVISSPINAVDLYNKVLEAVREAGSVLKEMTSEVMTASYERYEPGVFTAPSQSIKIQDEP